VQPRRLVLVRHAEAASSAIDAERPLTADGAGHAAAIGTWLVQAGLQPDRAVVSPARRAMQTWEAAAAVLGPAARPTVDARIYDNTVESVLTVIQDTPEEVRTLAVVGHNPSVRELTGALDDGQGTPDARRGVEAGFPAGGVAVFLLDTPFTDLAPGTATLTDFTVPRA
jgi:phosphohistidine phosphatase